MKSLEGDVLDFFELLLDELGRVEISRYAHKVGGDNGKVPGNLLVATKVLGLRALGLSP